ncbi:MAG: phage antirepressor KilAC domain-containing protein, partial [Peptoniphilus harei]|nr:phage antirepressor KilAC domain-containing protein [Peptoniphilus harei]
FLHGKEESAGKLAFVALAEWKIKATMELEKQKDLISTQNEQLEQQKPKVQFAEQVAVSKDSISVNEMAKLLHKNGVNIGRNRLFEWLREKKLVMKVSDGNNRWSNIPTQVAMNRGLLTIVEKSYTDAWGESRISTTTVVTPKGQEYILKKFFVGAFFS